MFSLLAAEEPVSWNVSEPDFSVAAQSIDIDTTQGTWMSLDVHPKGSSIVFDLLGDLYLLPVDGGEARNISPGFHWDMQPRFSPDGSMIAFTSDRDGGDNIWIMNADGSQPRQISKETFRLVNNASWSPDGQYLAARKHFTTQRSLGAGEVWLYHLSGGKGVKLVERPNARFQKELGEPVYAPDGSGVYYSQNVTSGDTFVYAQDTNQEVFRIRKYLFTKGERVDVAGGAGGAVTPTPSPDGRYLAFVRRVRADSRLFVKDLISGEERMLVDQLDRDMQETWAIHGLYPNMAFTPDSKAVVFWRNGGIHRVEVDSGQITPIPFHVQDTRTIYPAPRFAVEVEPDVFRTRMPRWAQRVASSERSRDRVIFESLGRLYLKSGDARPVRLTTDDAQVSELFPELTRDGKWVYYVAWNDQQLGRIMRVASSGGKPGAIDLPPGHYRELAISPDGETLVFRRAAGGGLLNDAGSMHPGIYQVGLRGGIPQLVSHDGQLPQFAAENNRLYLLLDHGTAEEGGRAPVKLVSMNLDGGHVRDVVSVAFASTIRISPDGRYVGFVENFHAYVTPLPDTGKLIELGAKSDGLPLRRVSETGATVLDLAGKTVIPGLIDAHAHGVDAQELIVPQRNWSAQAHLAFGVTTVHDPSNQANAVLTAAEYARAGLVTTPRTYSSAEIVYGARSRGWTEIETFADALAHVRRLKAQGAHSIKNYNQPRRAQRQQVTEAARREQMLVVSEGAALYQQDMNMVADGNSGIEHSLPQLAIYADVVAFWRQTNVGYTPTLGVGYGGLEGEKFWYQHTDVWKHPLLSLYVPPRILQARSVRREMAPDEDYVHRENAAIGKRLADAGVLVNAGAHGQREGLAMHWELWMFVQGGMSPLEALRTATISSATYLGMDKDLGSLEPGKVADMVVIDGDVAADITVSDRVTHVMLNGRLFDAATLNETLTGNRTQQPFYWAGKQESAVR